MSDLKIPDWEKERDFAHKMLLNEHTRWNHWSIFFLGGLIAIATFAPITLGKPIMFILFLCLSILWIGSAFAIKESTWGWIETIKKLEKDRNGLAWTLFEDKKKEWKECKKPKDGKESKNTYEKSEFNETFHFWDFKTYCRVTNNLIRLGYIVILISIGGICYFVFTPTLLSSMSSPTYLKLLAEKDSLNKEITIMESRNKISQNEFLSEIDKLKKNTIYLKIVNDSLRQNNKLKPD